MSYFLNSITPVNQFTKTTKEKYFVDKSELIERMNELVGTASQYVCITRPRRFGKTINAMMLACYYSKNADFKKLFDGLEISKSESYLEHLNKHNVIYMTMNELPKPNCSYEEFIDGYIKDLVEDVVNLYPNVKIDKSKYLPKIFSQIYNETNESFIFIIDEWDYIFNNNLFSEKDRENFLQFLKDLLKDKPYVELAYMTGVLPIAKYSSGSALNMFKEYNILNDKKYNKYFGFTFDETKKLCAKQDKIIQYGVDGLKRVTYKIKYQNNIEIEKTEISSEIIKEPIDKIVEIRTKQITSRSSTFREASTNPALTASTTLAKRVEGITPKVATFNTSAYCPCMSCCGKTNGITASGAPASEWYTLAAGSVYPIGTVIYIPYFKDKPNGGWFVVQDRGGAISSDRLDIFYDSHSAALQFGRRYLECYVYEF